METEANDLGATVEESVETPILIPCTICGRTFKSESLIKHQGVCQKNANKKRKVFDSMKQRIKGTELAEYIPIPVIPPKPKFIAITKVGGGKSSRDGHRQIGDSPNVVHQANTPEKTRHVAVRSNSISSSTPSRGGGAALKEKCPHCDRTFGWKAFSRHEEWCREHTSRLAQAQSPAAVLKAKEMLAVRIKYRAPLVGKSKRPTNREKYAAGAAVHGPTVVSHSLPKSSMPDVHLQNILSPMANVPSNTRERKTSAPKTSTVSSHHQPVVRKISAPVMREMSPTKEIPHIINPPWDLNITNEASTEAKDSTSSSRNRDKRQECGDDLVHQEAKETGYNANADDKVKKEEDLIKWVKEAKRVLCSMKKNPKEQPTEKKERIGNVSKATAQFKHEENNKSCRYNSQNFYEKTRVKTNNSDRVYNAANHAVMFEKIIGGNDSQRSRNSNSEACELSPTEPSTRYVFESNVGISPRSPVNQTEGTFSYSGQGDIDHTKLSAKGMERKFMFKVLESSDGSSDNREYFTEDRFEEVTGNLQNDQIKPIDQTVTLKSVHCQQIIPQADLTPNVHRKSDDKSQNVRGSKSNIEVHIMRENGSKKNSDDIKSPLSFGTHDSFDKMNNSRAKLNDLSVNSEGIIVTGPGLIEPSNFITLKDISQLNSNQEENGVMKQQCRMIDNKQCQIFVDEAKEENNQKAENKQKKQSISNEKDKNKPESDKDEIIFTKCCEITAKNKINKHISGVVEKKEIDRRRSKLPVPVPNNHNEHKIKKDESICKNNIIFNGRTLDSIPEDSQPSCNFKNLNNTFILNKHAFEELEGKSSKYPATSKSNQHDENSFESTSNENSPISKKGVIRKCNLGEFEKCTWAEICEIKGGLPIKYSFNNPMQFEYYGESHGIFAPGTDKKLLDTNASDKTNEAGQFSKKKEGSATPSALCERRCEVSKWSGAFTNSSCCWRRGDLKDLTLDFTKSEISPIVEQQKSDICLTSENCVGLTNGQPHNSCNKEESSLLKVINSGQSCLDQAELKVNADISVTSCDIKKNHPDALKCFLNTFKCNDDTPLLLEDLSTTESNFGKTVDQSTKTEGLRGDKTYVFPNRIDKCKSNFIDVGVCDKATQSDDIAISRSPLRKIHSTAVLVKSLDVCITNRKDVLNKEGIAENDEKVPSTEKSHHEVDSRNDETFKKVVFEDARIPSSKSLERQKGNCEEKSLSEDSDNEVTSDMQKLNIERGIVKGLDMKLESKTNKDMETKSGKSSNEEEKSCLSQENKSNPQTEKNERKCLQGATGNYREVNSTTPIFDLEDKENNFKESSSDPNRNSTTESSKSSSSRPVKSVHDDDTVLNSNKYLINYEHLSEKSSGTSVSICSVPTLASSHCRSGKKSTDHSPRLISIMNRYSTSPKQVNPETNYDSGDVMRAITPRISQDKEIKSVVHSNHRDFEETDRNISSNNEEYKKPYALEKYSIKNDHQKLSSDEGECGFKPLICSHKKLTIEDETEPLIPSQNLFPVIKTSYYSDVASAQIKWLNFVKKFGESDSDSVESLEIVQEISKDNPCSKCSILEPKIGENKVKRKLFEEGKFHESNSSSMRLFGSSGPLESSFPEKGVTNDASSNHLSVHGRKLAKERIKKRLARNISERASRRNSGERSPCPSGGYSPSHSQYTSSKGSFNPSSEQLPSLNPVSHYSSKSSTCHTSPPESTIHHCKSSEDDRGGGESPVKKTPYRLSTYDPFSRAEMQLKELLSDGGDFQKPKIAQSTPIKESHKNQTPDTNNLHESHVPSALNNGNLNVHNILNNQKQAKEDVLPDLFTETSMQLHFEMPNVMRGREESVMTKRRAMKPTAQNMGIDLNPIARESMTGRRDFITETIETQSENQKEHFTSLKDFGNKVPENSNSVKGSVKLEGGDLLDIESIHQSINMVALGLSNLSTNSHESIIDVDNNNSLSGSKTITERAANVDSSGNLMELGQSKGLTSHSTHPASSGDGESDGDPKRIRRRKRRGKTLPEGEVRDDVSSPDCLVTFQNPISAKLSVDSAYSSLNRPSLRAVEEAKRAINKAFDSQHHQTSSEGEDDHADEWSEDEESKKNPTRWNQDSAAVIDPAAEFKMAKFCHECGSRYPLTQAKFCCVCGARRLTV